MVRVIGWIGLLWLLCPLGLHAAPANDAPAPDGLREYHERLGGIFRSRARGVAPLLSEAATVHVRFLVGRGGLVTRSEIATSSGQGRVDDLALRIVPVGLKLPPLPAGVPGATMDITLPLRFQAIRPPSSPEAATYRDRLARIFMARIQDLPHRMPTGGMVHVRFVVGGDGVVTRSEIATPSGLAHIDDLALRVVPVGLKLPPAPSGSPTRSMSFTLPLRFNR